MKKIKYGIIFITVLLFAIFTSNIYAGSLNLNNLKFEATLNEDGSMNVTETWDIDVSDTNTLYKTIKLSSGEFDGFSDASVYEVLKDGTKIPFYKTDVEAYHVEKGYYYSLINSKSLYEIAWGVSIDSSETKRYEINYTVNNIIHKYTDCEELYWQFLGNDFEIYADKVEGTIYLPDNSLSKEDVRVWAHGPLNGNIYAIDNNKVEFEVSNLQEGNMLEVRVVTPPGVFTSSTNYRNNEKLDEILAEETKWANEANARREKAARQRKMFNIGVEAFSIISGLYLFTKIIKYAKILKNTPKQKPVIKLDYYREIPGGKETVPSDAAFMQGSIEANIPNTISATMLDLAIRKAISFEIVDTGKKKKEVKVNLLLEDSSSLKTQEQPVYDYLKKVCKKDNSFNMKDLEEYIEEHITSFNSMTKKVIKETKEAQIQKENYSLSEEEKSTKYVGISALYFVLLCFLVFGFIMILAMSDVGVLALIPTVLTLITYILTFRISSRYTGFTQKGINEKEEWKGLKKYMKDFSLLNEKEVPALVLWEQYLVYATVFGIAEKVLKQLKVKYPEMLTDDMLNKSTYMYLMYNNGLNDSLTSSITKSIASSYSTGNYSSGSGSGGGFSGGGRRRLWRRWRRRPLK